MCHQVYVCTLFNIFTMCHLVAWVVLLFIDCQRIFFVCVLLLSCLILHRFVDLLWSRLSLYTLSSHSIQLIAVYWKTSFVATVRDIILCIHKNFSSHLMMLQLLLVFFPSVHRQTSSLLWLISCILNILTKVIEKSM